MKAICIEQFGGRDVLQIKDVPRPLPEPGEVVVAVQAAGVNPVDWKIRAGLLQGRLPHQFPIVPGWDVAGIIAEVGSGVSDWQVGDEVYAYARKPVIQHGTYAEYVAIEISHIARKPANLSFAEAASIPLAALTAYQSLFDAANLQAGESVLIQAAAGGVGGFAVQLAHHAGAKVWGTASTPNHDYIQSLGADIAIDYQSQNVAEVLRADAPDGMDLVYDCVGGAVFDQSIDLLKPQGRLVTILEPVKCQEMVNRGVAAHYVFVSPNGAQLETLRKMVEAGSLQTHLAAVLPLEEAIRAHEMIESQHTRGKIVLTLN